MEDRFVKLEKDVEVLKADVGVMKTDVAVLKTDASYIKRDVSELRVDIREVRQHQGRDFRIMFGSMIGLAMGLAGLIAKGFGWFH
jgi:hypothetical protein